MKNKKIIRLFTAALAVALCATAFAVPAFAGGGEGEPYYTETAGLKMREFFIGNTEKTLANPLQKVYNL